MGKEDGDIPAAVKTTQTEVKSLLLNYKAPLSVL